MRPLLALALSTLAVSAAAPAHAQLSGTPYPVEQVQRGQRATAHTVFTGAKIETFEIELLGVLNDALGPGYDLVLGRLVDERGRFTGVVAGMSGSPVYVDGKLLGALSYRYGAFGKEPICGITPITQMRPLLKERGGRPPLAAAPPRFEDDSLRPIETPLSISGVPSEVLAHFAPQLRAAGLHPMRGGGPSAGGAKGLGPDALQPGSAVAGLLVSGDIHIAGTGTVTWREGKRLVAFGHPFFGLGQVDMPMATARIVHTLASEANSFKISQVDTVVGRLYADRLTAIAGEVGLEAQTLPVTVHIAGGSENAAQKSYRYEILRAPVWTGIFAQVVAAASMGSTLRHESLATVDFTVEAALRDRDGTARRVVAGDSFSDPGGLRAAMRASRFLGNLLDELLGQDFHVDALQSLSVRATLQPGGRALSLGAASLVRSSIDEGDTLALRLALRPHDGELRHRELRLPLPESLKAGARDETLTLLLGSGRDVEAELKNRVAQHSPRNLGELARQIEKRRRNDHLHAVLLRKTPSSAVGNRALPSLPTTAALGLARVGTAKVKEAALVAEVSHPVGAPLSGDTLRELPVRLRASKRSAGTHAPSEKR